MTANQLIYFIHQRSDLLKAWRELTDQQKRLVVEAAATAEPEEIERIIEEVVDGQRRLF